MNIAKVMGHKMPPQLWIYDQKGALKQNKNKDDPTLHSSLKRLIH